MSDIAERVRDAHASARTLRIAGAGTWLAAGRPVRADDTVSLADHTGILEYVPGDLTLTARAGTRLRDIVAATEREGQWLPLDPWGGDDGTLGATLSTATAGPHAHATGLPRDVVLGMEFVTGAGTVIRCGGRVVKNVAGFDLTRMMIGSWGTLGVITSATVRLRGRPERTLTTAIAVADGRGDLSELATRLRQLPFTPLACETVSPRAAALLGLGDRTLLLVRLAGNERAVEAQRRAITAFGDSRDVDESVWRALRTFETGSVAVWRWSHLPGRFGETWSAADRACRAVGGANGAAMHGNPARGVVRIVAHATSRVNGAELARAIRSWHGTVNVERVPDDAWPHMQPVADDRLSRGIRDTFNPGGTLNAGIFGDA